MDRDNTLTLVRTLTRPVVELFSPAQLDDFEDDFAVWTLGAGALGVSEKSYALAPPAHGLDTTLVAGMFFQVVMEASRLPTGSQERVSFIRKRAKDYLVTQLAGQITLSQFYRLLTIIEAEAGLYFTRHDWSGGNIRPAGDLGGQSAPAPAYARTPAVAGAGQERGLAAGAGQGPPARERQAQAHPRDPGGLSPGDRRRLVSPAGF